MTGRTTTRGRSRLLGALGAGTAVVLLCQAAAPGTTLPASVAPAPGATAVAEGATTYVVQTDDVTAVGEQLADLGAAPTRTFEDVGSLTVALTPAQLAALEAGGDVAAVAPEQEFSVDATQAQAPWGLDRIDQAALPLDQSFTYDDVAGAGVRVYVVDTGVSGGTQLSGRLAAGMSAVAGSSSTTDCHGHGTHVAGTVAGTTFGVAKKATVVPVRVLDCEGRGSTSTVVAGLDWVLATHAAGTPGVVNLSLGGPRNEALDAAVEEVVRRGLVVVAAAGNKAEDACTQSPAAAPAAVTVGASDEHDDRAYFSNHGPCLDVFAPGNRIMSTSLTYASGAELRSGTSMAAPHASGVAALVLARNPGATATQVAESLRATSRDVVADPRSPGVGLLSSSSALVAGSMAPSRTSLYVQEAYQRLVGRAPSSTSAATWTSRLDAGASRLTLASSLTSSVTYRGQIVDAAYGTYLDRSPSATMLAQWRSKLGAGSTQQDLEAYLLASATYYSLAGGTPRAWVETMSQDLLGRAPTTDQLARWTPGARTVAGRTSVARTVLASTTHLHRRVDGQYQLLLGRASTAKERTTWTTNLRSGVRLETFSARLVASTELWNGLGEG